MLYPELAEAPELAALALFAGALGVDSAPPEEEVEPAAAVWWWLAYSEKPRGPGVQNKNRPERGQTPVPAPRSHCQRSASLHCWGEIGIMMPIPYFQDSGRSRLLVLF